MIKISTAQFVRLVRAHATERPPGNLDPRAAPRADVPQDTQEGSMSAPAIGGLIDDHDFDEADLFAFGHTTLDWRAEFAGR